MNEEMLQDIKTSFCKIEIEYKDKWSYKETVDMGVIHSPESCLIKFRDDGHVFIDDICVK